MSPNQILCGDAATLLKDIPDQSIDMVLTSPPYDEIRPYDGYTFDFPTIAQELSRVIVKGGVIVWVVADQVIKRSESLTSFKQAIFFKEQCGLLLHDTQLYGKTTYPPKNHRRYEQSFEYMFVFSKGPPKTFNPILLDCKHAGKTSKSSTMRQHYVNELVIKDKIAPIKKQRIAPNIFFYTPTSTPNVKHPAKFPLKLAHDQIKTWTNLGDIVLDPCAGSFNTCVEAHKLERKWIGMDISPEYCEIGRQRLI